MSHWETGLTSFEMARRSWDCELRISSFCCCPSSWRFPCSAPDRWSLSPQEKETGDVSEVAAAGARLSRKRPRSDRLPWSSWQISEISEPQLAVTISSYLRIDLAVGNHMP